MPVTTSYLICAMPRTGGSLLCEALESTGIAGLPWEYFEPIYEKDWRERLRTSGDSDYFEKVVTFRSTPNGVFGAKVIWPQFELMRTRLRTIHGSGSSDLELLNRAFPGLRFIWLRRRDKLRQAISYYKAVLSDVWHSVRPDSDGEKQDPAPATSRTAPFDYERIDSYCKYVTQADSNWTRYFDEVGVQPFELFYEEFSDSYAETVLKILDYLRLPVPPGYSLPPPRLQKLSDPVTEEWIRRYQDLKRTSRSMRKPVRSYFIGSTPRTGGFLLAEALESTGIAGRPREYFDPISGARWLKGPAGPADPDPIDELHEAGTTLNRVFAAKLHWHHMDHLTARLRLIHGDRLTDLELLAHTFPGLRYVFLTRRDKVRQAISYHKANRTKLSWRIGPRG